MLKIEKLDKYFNRHKKNEIHVINNTSLEFGDSGLVALLGASGCGKTTLLNAIGGLDKVNRGKIYINGKRLPKGNSSKKDKMRVLNVGYIFQDYNLLENMSVFDNVALSLKMIGIKNKAEIKEKTEYVLEKVGMYRYRNKPAGALSGGQKQRVAIARAIVKNPAIIIADEPTGNLDSKNTIEVMNIIKSISESKLVILVTHEKTLAHFYANRIINIEDGKVLSDEENIHNDELDYKMSNKIYLKDFKNHNKLNDKDYGIDFYSDENEKVNLDIVIRNGNVYIKSKEQVKLEIVDDDSAIEFIDDHYKKISKEDYEKSKFDLTTLKHHKRLHYSSIYNVFTMIKTGFHRVFNYSITKKLLLIGFFVSAMFVVFSISSAFGVTNIKDKDFISVNKNYIRIDNNKNKVEDFLALESEELIDYIIPGDSNVTMDVTSNKIYQFKNVSISMSFSLASTNLVSKDDLLYGRMPEGDYEILIDTSSLDTALENESFQMIGINDYEDFVGVELKLNNLNKFIIVGVTNTGSPSGYVSSNMFTNIIANNSNEDEMNSSTTILDYELNQDDITIKKGRTPINDYEVIVNIDEQYDMPLNKTIDTKVNDTKLKVVGYYTSKTGDTAMYVNSNTIKYKNIASTSGMTLYSSNKDEAITYLQDKGYNAYDTYQNAKEKYLKEKKSTIIQNLITSGIILCISLVEIFFITRASFISRIKEVGIYRAIGVKKSDIYKMFLGEILVITTILGVPGYILISLLLNEFIKASSFFASLYVINAPVLITSIVLIYGFNILIGLLPIRNTIKKSPAEILARTDID